MWSNRCPWKFVGGDTSKISDATMPRCSFWWYCSWASFTCLDCSLPSSWMARTNHQARLFSSDAHDLASPHLLWRIALCWSSMDLQLHIDHYPFSHFSHIQYPSFQITEKSQHTSIQNLSGDAGSLAYDSFRTLPQSMNTLLLAGALPDQSSLVEDAGASHPL